MEGLEGQGGSLWNPLSFFGIDHPFLKIDIHTLINTWIILGFIFLVLFFLRPFLKKTSGVVYYIVDQYLEIFSDLTVQALGVFHYHHFAFVTSLFTFILLCNWSGFIPGLDEPTRDVNTALALGLTAFFYKEFYSIVAHGFGGYLHEFISPFFVMLPLNIISHLSKILSLSFRLFGNILGGSIITQLYFTALGNSILWQCVGMITGLNVVVIGFFIFFEGLIQAFVFAMLAITYLGMAVQSEEEA